MQLREHLRDHKSSVQIFEQRHGATCLEERRRPGYGMNESLPGLSNQGRGGGRVQNRFCPKKRIEGAGASFIQKKNAYMDTDTSSAGLESENGTPQSLRGGKNLCQNEVQGGGGQGRGGVGGGEEWIVGWDYMESVSTKALCASELLVVRDWKQPRVVNQPELPSSYTRIDR